MGSAVLVASVPDHAWQSILGRDRDADARFVFAVRTTSIFCRPSCPARRPARENVLLFRSPDEAKAAGFRACLRCAPEGPLPSANLVREALKLIGASNPTTTSVAKRLGVGVSTIQRAFTSETGLSFAQYLRAKRLERGRMRVLEGATLRRAAASAGLSSPSKLYVDGVHPSTLRTSGQTIHYAIASTRLGPLLVATTSKGLCLVRFGEDAQTLLKQLRRKFVGCDLQPGDAPLRTTVAEIIHRIEGRAPGRDLPLDVQATAFRLRVWKELAKIPHGATVSYSALARRVDAPHAIRAVASACASNELAVVVPCHRVVGKDGSLSGYRWGLERKRALLAAEAQESDV